MFAADIGLRRNKKLLIIVTRTRRSTDYNLTLSSQTLSIGKYHTKQWQSIFASTQLLTRLLRHLRNLSRDFIAVVRTLTSAVEW